MLCRRRSCSAACRPRKLIAFRIYGKRINVSNVDSVRMLNEGEIQQARKLVASVCAKFVVETARIALSGASGMPFARQ